MESEPISRTSTLRPNSFSIPYLMILASAWPEGQLGMPTTRSDDEAVPQSAHTKTVTTPLRVAAETLIGVLPAPASPIRDYSDPLGCSLPPNCARLRCIGV